MKIDDMRKLVSIGISHTPEGQEKLMEHLRELGIDMSNLYQELEMSSRFVNAHRDTSYSNGTVSLHSHSYYEIIHCRTNSGVEYLIGSQRYRLQKGDVILVPPGISHRPILPEHMAEPYERDVLWISELFIREMDRLCPGFTLEKWDYSQFLRTSGTRWDSLGALFRACVKEEEERRPGWEIALFGNAMTILAHMKRAYMEHSTDHLKAEAPELLDRVTAYIESNYAGHITVSEIARQFYVSESSVSHLFKQKMGVSVYRYITQRRLIAAKSMILEGRSMEHVSRDVGFTDYSTFYRAFKQEFGISPRHFGKMQTGKQE